MKPAMLSADAGVPPCHRGSFTCLPMSSSQRIWSLLRVFQPVSLSISLANFPHDHPTMQVFMANGKMENPVYI